MAAPTFEIPHVPSRWPRRLLWLSPLLVLLLGAGAAAWQGQFVAERVLRLALGEGALIHSTVLPGWDGSLHLTDLRFGTPASDRLWLSAGRVHIQGTNWWWLLRNALRSQRLNAPLYQLQIRFEQVRVPEGIDPALGDLAPAGLSGAPLEALGCPPSTVFDENGLLEAGIALENRLEFSYEVIGPRLELRIGYHLDSSAGIERSLQQLLPMQLSLLVIDQYPLRTLGERWLLTDYGFSRIRHKRCAERGELIALVDRHVDLARNLAASRGLSASDDAWTSYRRYVRDGGQLALSLRYPVPAPLDNWFDRPRSASLLALSEAVLLREEQRLEFTPADAYTDGLSGDSPKSAQRLLLGDTLWIDPDTSLVLLEPELSGRAQGLQTGSPEPDPAPSEPAQPAQPAETPAPVATQPEPAPPPRTEPEPSRSGRGNTRVPIPEARLVVVGEQRSRKLDWAQLEGMVGKRVRITTRTGATRMAEIVDWSESEVTVRSRLGGGIAESRIQRQMFREAVEL